MHHCVCAVIQNREGSDQEEKLEELLAKLSTGSLRFDTTVRFLYLSECVADAWHVNQTGNETQPVGSEGKWGLELP